LPSHSPSSLPCHPAFTLTELLIVIGLIVLMLALALPAFNAITGGRSIDGAQNQLSAFLGRARAEAIGLQEVRGVMFFIDPASQRVTAAIVRATEPKSPETDAGLGANVPKVDVWLDLAPD